MDLVKKYFPVSLRASDVLGLVISIIIYLIVPVILGIVLSLVSGISILAWLVGIVMSVIGIYCFIGIVLAVLVFLKLLK